MKLIVTVSNADGYMHTGMPVEHESAIIEISEDQVPKILREHLRNKKWATEGENRHHYGTVTFSMLVEER